MSSAVYEHMMNKKKVLKITQGGNCIFEVDKASFEIKRRIIGNLYSPKVLKIEANGNLKIVALDFINNLTLSDTIYLITIDQDGKIIEKAELNGIEGTDDVILANNKIMATVNNKLKIFLISNIITGKPLIVINIYDEDTSGKIRTYRQGSNQNYGYQKEK